MHRHSGVLRILHCHRCPSWLPIVGSQEQIGIVDHVPISAEHAGSSILVPDVRRDVGFFHESIVSILVFLRPFGFLTIKWAGDLQNDPRVLLFQVNDSLGREHIHAQRTATDEMRVAVANQFFYGLAQAVLEINAAGIMFVETKGHLLGAISCKGTAFISRLPVETVCHVNHSSMP